MTNRVQNDFDVILTPKFFINLLTEFHFTTLMIERELVYVYLARRLENTSWSPGNSAFMSDYNKNFSFVFETFVDKIEQHDVFELRLKNLS